MRIVNLKLLNFRNYNHLTLSFSPNINVIYGKNGSGKTNLIEAIYVLGLTKSFRSSTDKVLVMKDKNLTKISGVVFDNINKELEKSIEKNEDILTDTDSIYQTDGEDFSGYDMPDFSNPDEYQI